MQSGKAHGHIDQRNGTNPIPRMIRAGSATRSGPARLRGTAHAHDLAGTGPHHKKGTRGLPTIYRRKPWSPTSRGIVNECSWVGPCFMCGVLIAAHMGHPRCGGWCVRLCCSLAPSLQVSCLEVPAVAGPGASDAGRHHLWHLCVRPAGGQPASFAGLATATTTTTPGTTATPGGAKLYRAVGAACAKPSGPTPAPSIANMPGASPQASGNQI